MIFVDDAGHDGWDSGAVGPAGTYESSVTLPVAQMVSEILQQAGQVALMSRTSSQQVVGSLNEDLMTRVQFAEAAGAELFVSFHANGSVDSSAHGFEVYTTPGQGPSDVYAESVIEELVKAFPELTLRSDLSDGDRDKEANFYVIRKTTMPAILIEMAFITNPQEEQLLASSDGQRRFAQAIATGLLNVVGVASPVSSLVEDVTKLQSIGVINSPQVWIDTIQNNQDIPATYVNALIKNMASYLRR